MKGGKKKKKPHTAACCVVYQRQEENISDLSCAMFSPETQAKWLPGFVELKFTLYIFLFKKYLHLY